MVHCIKCDNDVPYIIKKTVVEDEIRGVKISYIETSAHCPFCDTEIYVPWVNDLNVGARRLAYAKAANVTK